MAVNTTKKKSLKNRVKGFFSKIGSRFSRKKNVKQANNNFTKAIDVDELNQQTKELKNLLQRQVENAGNVNMDPETKQVVQNNIETTRKLIEARQQELTNRGEKEKLEQLKKNIESVGNVVKNAPSASSAPSSTNGNRLGNVSNLKVAAVNALKRMSGMDSVAAQIEALRNVIKECCKDGAGCGRNRSGSVSSVNSNNRGAANGAAPENAELNALFEEAQAGYAAVRAPKVAAPKGRPNFLEPNVKKGAYPPKGATPKGRPNFLEPKGRRGTKKVNNKANSNVNPSGLFGSNNFEEEPARANKANNKANNNVNPSGLYGSNNFEEEAPRANKANNKANNNVNPSGLFGSNNFEEEPARANKPNNMNSAGLPGSNNFEEEPEAAPEASRPEAPRASAPGGDNNNYPPPYQEENISIRGQLLKRLGLNKSASESEIQRAFRTASATAARAGTRNTNNYKSLTSMYANWRNSEKVSGYKEGNLPAEEMNYAGEQVNEAAARAAAEEAEMDTRAKAARATSAPANNTSSANLSGSNKVNNKANNANKLLLSNNVKKENNNANNNVSPAGLFGSNNFENEPSKPSKSGRLPKPTMNNLTADEKERVRLFKNLNSSITNNNALNLIRQEREQTASRTKKGGRRTQRKKRSVSRKKSNASRKNRK